MFAKLTTAGRNMTQNFSLTVLLVTAFLGATGPAAAAEGCVVHYKGDWTEFAVACDDTDVSFNTSQQHLKDMVRVEDISPRSPLGGPNSLGNEVVEKGVEKPMRWLGDRLGF